MSTGWISEFVQRSPLSYEMSWSGDFVSISFVYELVHGQFHFHLNGLFAFYPFLAVRIKPCKQKALCKMRSCSVFWLIRRKIIYLENEARNDLLRTLPSVKLLAYIKHIIAKAIFLSETPMLGESFHPAAMIFFIEKNSFCIYRSLVSKTWVKTTRKKSAINVCDLTDHQKLICARILCCLN